MSTKELQQRLRDYLAGGGLFNPELADHDAVRDLLIACRDTLASLETQNAELRIGSRRYETVRRLGPQAFLDAYVLNRRTGKAFDEIVDDLRPFVFPAAASHPSPSQGTTPTTTKD